jgi:hypothetical protein
MNFNYRDFFIHNDDLHIIKEQLSIVDETGYVPQENALEPNAKDVWDMYKTGSNEKTIAEKLEINVETVEKIIQICLMKATDNKITVKQIAAELKLSRITIYKVLNNALGSDLEKNKDLNFIKDAVIIYNLHKQGKKPDEIVNLINQNRKPYLQIKLDKVNLVLKIVDIATKQMENDGVTNTREIERQISGAKNDVAIAILIKKLNLGTIKYKHEFTEEQDAFILFNYLQGIGPSVSARSFNDKFKTDSSKLNISHSAIRTRLINTILKSNSESKISEYALKLLTKYFPKVNINNPDTKELLTHYTPPETVGGRDRTGTGTNRDMSAHLGTLPNNFNTMVTNLRNAHTIR